MAQLADGSALPVLDPLTSSRRSTQCSAELVNQHRESGTRGAAQMREAEETMRALGHLHPPNRDSASPEPIGVTARVVSQRVVVRADDQCRRQATVVRY